MESCRRTISFVASHYDCKLNIFLKPISVWKVPDDERDSNPSKAALQKQKFLSKLPSLPKDVLGIKCDNRLGALEVQVSATHYNQNYIHILHSKILSGRIF